MDPVRQLWFICKRTDPVLEGKKNWLGECRPVEPWKIIVHRTPDSFNHRIPCNDWKKLQGNLFRDDSEIDTNPKVDFFVSDLRCGPKQIYHH